MKPAPLSRPVALTRPPITASFTQSALSYYSQITDDRMTSSVLFSECLEARVALRGIGGGGCITRLAWLPTVTLVAIPGQVEDMCRDLL